MVDFDDHDKFFLCVTTIKAMDFRDGNPPIANDNFKDNYQLVFELISMEDVTEKCHYIK